MYFKLIHNHQSSVWCSLSQKLTGKSLPQFMLVDQLALAKLVKLEVFDVKRVAQEHWLESLIPSDNNLGIFLNEKFGNLFLNDMLNSFPDPLRFEKNNR